MKPIYQWDEDTGESLCILTDGKNVFCGTATCHNQDADMKNEKTGLEIAYRRAKIKALVFNRDCEIKPALSAYNQLYYSMNKSKHFNPKSYENKMLQRKIKEKESDLEVINEMISKERKSLIDYLQKKEDFYQHIRKNRAKVKNN